MMNKIRKIFQKRVWVENDAGWIGTFRWVNREWVEAVGSIIALVMILGVAILALIVL